MMQDPGDSEDGLPPGPQPLLEGLLEQEKRAEADPFMNDGSFGGVAMFKLMIWIRDGIKRLYMAPGGRHDHAQRGRGASSR